jgi:hypothetical protein
MEAALADVSKAFWPRKKIILIKLIFFSGLWGLASNTPDVHLRES